MPYTLNGTGTRYYGEREQPAPLNWRQVLNVHAVAIPLACILGWLLHKALTRLFNFV